MARARVMDNRFFNECIARDDASKLKSILRAIPKWEEVAVAEVRATESADSSQMTSEQQHWHGEYVNDQFYMIDATKNGLLAGLSVAIASTVENFMGMLCAENEIVLPARPMWSHKRNGVEQVIGMQLDTLTGFDSANRARLLGNCFKHNGGKTNQDWVDDYGGPLDEEIRYENENWGAIIGEVEAFLLEVVKNLPTG
jgi:hypothetical protein